MGINILDQSKALSIDVQKPKVPEKLSDKEKEQIESMADQVVKKLESSDGSQIIEYIEQVGNVGFKAQQSASTKLDLFQSRMGQVFNHKESLSSQITDDVVSLKKAMRSINPSDIKKEWLVSFLEALPFGNKLVNVLQRIDVRRESVEKVISTIEASLTNGRNMIVKDNAELGVLHKDLEGTQTVVQKNAYLAEVMAEKLDELIANTVDTQKQGQYKNVLFRVVTRGQDLRAMEAAYEQFFVSIKLTKENNSLLIDTSQRMLTLAMPVLSVAFAIHVALAEQGKVLDAVKATRDFIGGMLIQNATAIRDNIKETAELYKEPIIAIQSIEKAQQMLVQAIDEVDRLKTVGIQTARENIMKLKYISEEMRQKAEGNAGTIMSLEANDYKVLPSGEEK